MSCSVQPAGSGSLLSCSSVRGSVVSTAAPSPAGSSVAAVSGDAAAAVSVRRGAYDQALPLAGAQAAMAAAAAVPPATASAPRRKPRRLVAESDTGTIRSGSAAASSAAADAMASSIASSVGLTPWDKGG